MSLIRQIFISVFLGIIIGILVPQVFWHLPVEISDKKIDVSNSTTPEENYYYFNMTNEKLAVIQSLNGQNQRILLSGIDVSNWPQQIIDLARITKFKSFDEVQSFLDSTRETH